MLEITRLSKTFYAGMPDERKVIRDFSLSLSDGEFVTLIGGNGAGKSTLFNLIAGTLLPDGGKILLDGQNITFLPEHRRASMIGRIFQDPSKGTAPNLTVEENLSIAYMRSTKRHLLGGVTKKDKAFLRERLSHLGLGLEDRMQVKIGLLSGGQRQAVTLCMATLVKPRLLLLDEHTAALDPVSADKIMALTRSIVGEGQITTLMITHNMTSAIQTGTRLLMMDEGTLAVDIGGQEKENLSVSDLLARFSDARHKTFDSDRTLLG